MRVFFVTCILVCTILGCAEKITPDASANTRSVKETKAPVAIKTTIVPVESSMAKSGHWIYEEKCGHCHSLKNPSDYTVSKWESILNTMAGKANLDSFEKADVLAYVSFYAKM